MENFVPRLAMLDDLDQNMHGKVLQLYLDYFCGYNIAENEIHVARIDEWTWHPTQGHTKELEEE